MKDKAPNFPELFHPCFCLQTFVCAFFVYVVFLSAKNNFLSHKFRRNWFLVEPENNILPQRKYILVKIYSSTVVLRRCFDDATRHPGPKKEKKLFSFSTFEYFKLFS